MSAFEPDHDRDEDVVSLTGEETFYKKKTFTVAEFAQALITNTGLKDVWVKGLPCRYLSCSGGSGWQEGRVRITLEFEPVEIAIDESVSRRTEPEPETEENEHPE